VEDALPPAEDPSGLRRIPWPRVVVPYLDGESTFALRPVDGEGPAPETVARFGNGTHPVRFADSHGLGLMVNKWGNIGHALSDYPAGIEQRLLDRLDLVRSVIDVDVDVDVYVTGGTLLGPYRDGRVMPNDDDADLAYLSKLSHPLDVARECFALGRALVAAGITVVRCSAGHLQLHFEHEGRPDGYVDIFTGWIDDSGWWYQLFPIRAQVRREQLVPPATIEIEGRPEPMCREPEVMLEAIYGPGWASPDPAFSFDVPQTTQDRFYGWMSDQHMNRTPWEDRYRYDILGNRVQLGTEPTEYVQWLADRLAPASFVVELGAGRGHDALWLAQQGHRVEAVDYVRWPMARAAEFAAERELSAGFRTLNLYDPRRIIAFGAEMAARREPITVYARDVLATMWDVGRPNLFRLLNMLLRGGGEAHLDVPHESLHPDPKLGGPMHRAVDLDVLIAEMAPYGLVVTETAEVVEEITWPGGRQQPEGPGTPGEAGTTEDVPWDSETHFRMEKTRMVVSWQRPRR
jgi:SAM-dependent methyltransferase